MKYKMIEFQGQQYKQFECKEDAEAYREELHGDDCMDGLRFTYMPFSLDEKFSCTIAEEEWYSNCYQEYLDIKEDGCCGFMDEAIFIGKQQAVIGCNFGH